VFPEFDLTDVEVEEISFVPRGANQKQYLLFKESGELNEEVLRKILEAPDEGVSRVLKEAKIEGQAAEVLMGAAKLLKAHKGQLPENALELLAKSCVEPEPEPEETDDEEDSKGGESEGSGPAVQKELSREQLEKMDPGTRKIIEKALHERDQARAEASEALRIAKELKEKEVLKEYITKAEELENLPLEPLKHGAVFKILGESHPKEFSEVFKILKAADKLAGKSLLLQEIGKGDPGGEGSAEAEVYSKARGLVAKDADLTLDQAVVKILEDNPELYSRYEEERQQTVKRRGGK